MRERNWDILGIAETRLKGKNGRRVIHDNYLLLYQGDDDGRHGVAIVLSPAVSNNIERIEYVSNGGLVKFKPNGFPGQINRGETPYQILPHIICSLYSRIPREYKYT